MAFAAGQKIRASYFNTAAVSAADVSVVAGTTTSATFVNSLTTTGIQGVVFTAGISGIAEVCWQSSGANGTAGAFVLSSSEIRAGSSIGSGTVFALSDESTAPTLSSDPGSQAGQLTGTRVITGLTSGAVYNACLTYRVSAGTGTYGRRQITVKPLLA